MITVCVNIVGFVAEHQPNIVEARLIDAWGHEWVFRDKCAIFTPIDLNEGSLYPLPGVIGCQIINQEHDAQGREIITIDTEMPWHIETIEGETQFSVLPQQISGQDNL